jgi:hypothetical protein
LSGAQKRGAAQSGRRRLGLRRLRRGGLGLQRRAADDPLVSLARLHLSVLVVEPVDESELFDPEVRGIALVELLDESMRVICTFAGWTENALWSVSGPKLPMNDLKVESYCCSVCAPVYPINAYVVPL